MSNGGRSTREAFLLSIEASDPAMYAELVAMRSRDPQGFRKRIRTLSTRAGEPIKMLVNLDVNEGYPGRARDPGLEGRVADVANAASPVVLPGRPSPLSSSNADITSGAADEAVKPKKPSKGKGARGEEVSKENVHVKAEDTTSEAATVSPIGVAAAPPSEAAEEEKPKKSARKKKGE
jgi:hypothetical protein